MNLLPLDEKDRPMKISVIIPVYNTEKYLSRCLEHVINQTYKNLEIIIVDDGSTDSSLTIAKRYAKQDKRIKILHQENSGPANARNNGLSHASGDYIHFMDADDIIDEDYYAMMLAAAESTGADVAVSGLEQEGERWIVYKSQRIMKTQTNKFRYTFAFFLGFCWRYLIRRDFLIKTDLRFPNRIMIEDLLFVIEMLRLANRVVSVPNVFYHYLINPTSCTRSDNIELVVKRNVDYNNGVKEIRIFAKKYGLEKIRKKHWYNKLPFFGYVKKKIITIK